MYKKNCDLKIFCLITNEIHKIYLNYNEIDFKVNMIYLIFFY